MTLRRRAVLAALVLGTTSAALVAPTLSAALASGQAASAAKVKVATTTRVSLDPTGAQFREGASQNVLSGDGKVAAFVVFRGVPGSGGGELRVRNLATGRTTIANHGDPMSVTLSRTGRYVAFTSYAANLVKGDTNGTADIFVYDTQAKATTRVTVTGNGAQSNGYSDEPAISADGRFVTFISDATNLVPGKPTGRHSYLHDIRTGRTSLVTATPMGTPAKKDTGGTYGGVYTGDVSDDGRYVTFMSGFSDLVPGDTNNTHDVFVRDMVAGKTTLISQGLDGKPANDYSADPTISADGSTIAFISHASNLVRGVTAGGVYVRNVRTGVTELVSRDAQGTPLPGFLSGAQISGNGRSVAFTSQNPRTAALRTARAARVAPPMSRVFVRNLDLRRTMLVSVNTAGAPANARSYGASLSDDGTRAVFTSDATNLVAGDTNAAPDAFLRILG